MKRLIFPAVLAFSIHGALFRVEIPFSRPGLMLPRSQAVSIDLVAYQKPVEKPLQPPAPVVKPKPKPKPRPKPKPLAKPAVPPEPVAQPESTEPLPEHFSVEDVAAPVANVQDAPPAPEVIVQEDGPSEQKDAVQSSVPLYHLNPPPRYPRTARRRNLQGTVLLDVKVTVEGLAAEVRIAESSGHAVLDRSAVKAVKSWRFSPARRGQTPIEMRVQVPVKFELH